MTREAFIRKWLANPQKQYNEQYRDEMRDDLDLVILSAFRQTANRLLPAAALWWRNLTAKQKAYMWDKYYDDHEITDERINERYEYDKRMSAEHAIDPNRF